MEKVRDSTCECCKSGEIETVQHTILHCPAFAKELKGFLERACVVQPGFDNMSRLKQVEIMLRSNSPKLLNPRMYRYLMLFFYSRQHQLRIPTAQGEGLRSSGIS